MTQGQTPYDTQSARAFWRKAVASCNPLEISGLWEPKFEIAQRERVITAGSCFAQHIGRAMAANGFGWYDAEPAPRGLTAEDRRAFNYGIFSFRTGNIYTTALLGQWVSWALGDAEPPDEVWEKDGRYFDPFRPVVEPGGFGSPDEMRISQAATVAAVRHAIEVADVFVFTLGLTESWVDQESGLHFPMCPGTAAGTFDGDRHVFQNLSYPEVRDGLERAIARIRRVRPDLRFLLTVSPVPLTATATTDHVLTSTVYSKSTLRAVAGDVANADDLIDYFPSYEIITGVPFRSMFFEPNMRSVSAAGVDFVMAEFFRCLGHQPEAVPAVSEDVPERQKSAEDVACEEELLEAFGPR